MCACAFIVIVSPLGYRACGARASGVQEDRLDFASVHRTRPLSSRDYPENDA